MMDAIITAGGIPSPDEHLYPYTKGLHKVLLEIEGKPIIQWVVDALNGSKSVNSIFIVGLPAGTGLSSRQPVHLLENQNDLMANIQFASEQVLKHDPSCTDALLVSGDVPGITPEMVKWLVAEVEKKSLDIHYSAVEKSVMEKVFPTSKRTYTNFKDASVSGGDMSAFNPRMALDPNARWRKLIDYRKDPLKQASVIGFDTLFLLFTRQLKIKDAERRVCNRLGITGEVLLAPFAEIGMDIDKPGQFEIMKEYLHSRR
jgi:molybdopterin-guanine dinucleotide biosynthesis protein A